MKEIWQDIRGYEGRYQVSSLGNVKSLNYRGIKGYERQLTQKKNNDGRMWVALYRNGTVKPMLVHRLVAMAFIPNPENLPQINHKDEKPANNCVENLEWCTGKYNIQYSMNRHPERYGNAGSPKGPRNGKRKDLPINQLTQTGEIVKRWVNSRTIFLETGMSDWSISECCRGKRKTAYGFRWQYAI